MKNLSSIAFALVFFLFLASCGGDPSTQSNNQESEVSPPDLTGEWTQVNSESEDSWQSATISDDSITVYWVSDNGDTKSLYWAGTYTAPENADEPYTWESINDTTQTSSALLASSAESKEFTYQDGQISYEVTALGTTTTVKLEK